LYHLSDDETKSRIAHGLAYHHGRTAQGMGRRRDQAGADAYLSTLAALRALGVDEEERHEYAEQAEKWAHLTHSTPPPSWLDWHDDNAGSWDTRDPADPMGPYSGTIEENEPYRD